MALSAGKITFNGHDGSELAGRLDLPEGTPKAFALWAHCFTCNKDIFSAKRVADALVAEGFGVLRFDFTGLGESDGDFANTNFTSNVADLVAAANFMTSNDISPSVIIGHSLGGAAVLSAQHQLDMIKAVVTIAAPGDPSHVSHNFESRVEEIKEKGEAQVLLANRPFTIKNQFLEDISNQQLVEKLNGMRKALLICHSPTDETVSIDHAKDIYAAAKHPKSFVSIDGADHLLRGKKDAEFVGRMIATWASRYI